MPTYNYECDDCGKVFDVQATIEEKIANDPGKFVCPECASSTVTQNFSLEMLIENAAEKSDNAGPTCPVNSDWAKEKRAAVNEKSGAGDSCKPGGGCC